jgi:cysteine desulfurase/selenocysteine lyase
MSQQEIKVDLKNLRKDFPIFSQNVAYLDSGATSQKPNTVLLTMDQYYKNINANVHRGVYEWAAKATEAFEKARTTIANFINAKPWETIFVRNATEAINLVSRAWGDKFVNEGDTIVVTGMEHHSNLVPWQQLAKRKNAKLEIIPVVDGELDMKVAEELLMNKPKLLAITHVSNVLGTVNPIHELTVIAHQNGAKVLIDACQSIPHLAIDVKALECDFLVFWTQVVRTYWSWSALRQGRYFERNGSVFVRRRND